MRVALLCSSPYSETGCATAARLAHLGYLPIGALTLPAWDRATLTRKLGQWGLRDSLRYAVAKLSPSQPATAKQVRNPYLEPSLRHEKKLFRSLRQVADRYRFPVVTVPNQNSSRALAQLKYWSPDVAIFTGGNILRDPILNLPRLGVLNSHLALLPEIRGMSSPEWSLVCGIPLGITIHRMDAGIDTGPILLRREFAAPAGCDSLGDLRHRMIAAGIDLIAEALASLDRGTLAALPQTGRAANNHTKTNTNTNTDANTNTNNDRQFFVMHERLKTIAAHRLQNLSQSISHANRDPSPGSIRRER